MTLWTSRHDVAAILADCAKRPPATRVAQVRDLTDRHVRVYVADERVRRLRKIWRAEQTRLLREGDVARDYTAFHAHCELTVDRAIDDAIADTRKERAAA